MNRNRKLAAVTGVVVTLGIVVFFVIVGIARKPEAPVEEGPSDSPAMIADFTPDAPVAAEPAAEAPAREPVPFSEPPKKHPDIGRKVTNSFGQVYTVARVSRPGVRRENGVEIEDKPLFRHDSLNELDALYRTTPGFRIFSSFDPVAFDADFGAALDSGELSEPQDERSDDEKRRIADVAYGVEQLKEALAEGKKPSEVIQETRQELAKLADYRDEVLSAITTMKNDGASAEEIETYYEAANKLFAEKDIPALLSPANVKLRLEAVKLRESEK
ncbi:MAG: hypothetical protein J6U17_05295 [Kiritimatiellae bacterium]|nr:hypothetical protein [Kiritimatiellia bacterium]